MNRRRRKPRLLVIILLGVISGIAFLLVDQSRPRPSSQATAPQPASPTAMRGIANVEATATPRFSNALAVTPSPTPIIARDIGPDIENATLIIPSAGVVAPIVRVYIGGTSWDVSNLGNNVGHLEGTRWVSEKGNVVLAGHVELSDGRQGIFANIDKLKIGDRVILTQNGIDYQYDVTSLATYESTNLTPVYPSPDNRITLITCGEYDFFTDSYLDRVVVVAEQVMVNES